VRERCSEHLEWIEQLRTDRSPHRDWMSRVFQRESIIGDAGSGVGAIVRMFRIEEVIPPRENRSKVGVVVIVIK